MPILLSTLIAANTTSTTVASKSKGGSPAFSLIFLVVIIAAGYFLFIRPRQAKARQAQTRGRQLDIGDDVVTIGGIMGRIVELDDQEVQVEVSPGVVMTFLRRAVNPRQAVASGRTSEPAPPVDDERDLDVDPDDRLPEPHRPDDHLPEQHLPEEHLPGDRHPEGPTGEGPAEDR